MTQTDSKEIICRIRKELRLSADKEYQQFQASLIPGVSCMMGVRVPKLREIAKRTAREDYWGYVTEYDRTVYEELMIRGMMIGYGKLTVEEEQKELKEFVPLLNNWSICDSCCATYHFMKKDQQEWFSYLKEWLKSGQEYEIRFAVVCLLDYFVEETYLPSLLTLFSEITSDAYYVKMAVSWALSVCYVKFPEETEKLLESGRLDAFTQNHTIQKIRESRRVSQANKERLKKRKRTED